MASSIEQLKAWLDFEYWKSMERWKKEREETIRKILYRPKKLQIRRTWQQ